MAINDKRIIDLINSLEDIFGKRLTTVQSIDARRMAVAALLENKLMFMRKYPSLKLVRLIEYTLRSSGYNLSKFFSIIVQYESYIKRLNNKLSNLVIGELDKIKKVYKDYDKFIALLGLHQNLSDKKDANFKVGLVKTHYDEISIAVDSLENRNMAIRLRKGLSLITKEEATFLIRYRDRAKNWNLREFEYGIPFFRKEAAVMLYGKDKEAHGLISFFRDFQLKDKFDKSAPFLMLITYQQQLYFIKRLMDKLKEGQDKSWSGFYEFWGKIDEIKREVLIKYGNSKLAQKIEDNKKTIGEYPAEWFELFNKELIVMESQEYIRTEVLMPFSQAFGNILDERLNEILSDNFGLDQLAKDISAAVNPGIMSINKITGISAKYMKTMPRKMKKIKKIFDSISVRCIDCMHDFLKSKQEVIDGYISRFMEEKENRIQNLARNEREHTAFIEKTAGKNVNNALRSLVSFGALLFSLEKASRAGALISREIRSVANFLNDKNVKTQIKLMEDNLRRVENAYSDLNKFMGLNFGASLTEPSARLEGLQNGGTEQPATKRAA